MSRLSDFFLIIYDYNSSLNKTMKNSGIFVIA